MKKKIGIGVYVFVMLITVFSFAFAQPNIGDNSILRNIVAHTDAQFASVLVRTIDQLPSFEIPSPPVAKEELQRAPLVDVTRSCTSDGEVVSAFPGIYKLFPSEENARIIKVYSLAYFKGGDQRVEVYYTGGDWMPYGLVYLITNAGGTKTE